MTRHDPSLAAVDTSLAGRAARWPAMTRSRLAGYVDKLVARADARARERAAQRRPHGVHGKVIAERPFGFWRFLTASRYLTTLWIPAL